MNFLKYHITIVPKSFYTGIQTKGNVIKLVILYDCKMSTLEAALDSRVFTGRKAILKLEL